MPAILATGRIRQLRLLAFYVPGRTLRIFSTEKDARPALMQEYLQQWYAPSRREAYYGSHQRGISLWAYWSWQAAAISCMLDIDDAVTGAPHSIRPIWRRLANLCARRADEGASLSQNAACAPA